MMQKSTLSWGMLFIFLEATITILISSFSENKLTLPLILIHCFVALQDSGENEEVAATRVDT